MAVPADAASSGPSSCRSRGHFARRQNSSHDWGVQLVLPLADIAGVIFHAQDEDRQGSFLVEILFRDGDRQNSVQAVFAVGGLVAVLARVPGEDADLIEVEGQPIVRIGQHAQVLRNLLLHAFVVVGTWFKAKKATKRWPSAYCAMSRGTSTSTMRASTHPTRL